MASCSSTEVLAWAGANEQLVIFDTSKDKVEGCPVCVYVCVCVCLCVCVLCVLCVYVCVCVSCDAGVLFKYLDKRK